MRRVEDAKTFCEGREFSNDRVTLRGPRCAVKQGVAVGAERLEVRELVIRPVEIDVMDLELALMFRYEAAALALRLKVLSVCGAVDGDVFNLDTIGDGLSAGGPATRV